jgi:hypothetical protein
MRAFAVEALGQIAVVAENLVSLAVSEFQQVKDGRAAAPHFPLGRAVIMHMIYGEKLVPPFEAASAFVAVELQELAAVPFVGDLAPLPGAGLAIAGQAVLRRPRLIEIYYEFPLFTPSAVFYHIKTITNIRAGDRLDNLICVVI